MYDFELGSRDDILANEKTYLLAVKRMLPRWLNSIADSEFIALCEIADTAGGRRTSANSVFVETGVGARVDAPSQVHHRSKENLILHLQQANTFIRFPQFRGLHRGRNRFKAIFNIGFGKPTPYHSIRDAKILRDLGNGGFISPRDLNSITTELSGISTRDETSLSLRPKIKTKIGSFLWGRSVLRLH